MILCAKTLHAHGEAHARRGPVAAVVGVALVALGLSVLWPDSASARDPVGPESETRRIASVRARGDLDFDLLDNEACEGCHPDVAREWEGSLHQRAYTNSAFQASHAREPLPFCQTCHAPRATQFPARTKAAAAGIDCVTCHVRDGILVAGPGPAEHDAPHPVERLAELGAPEGCGTCHQFEFPRKSGRRPGSLMQKTVDEHAASEYSSMDCADCHMTSVTRAGGRSGSSHRFHVSRNPAFMRAALDVEARRLDANRIELMLEPNEVGHFFPTGDLFRRVELKITARDAAGDVVHQEVKYLARHFPARSAGRFFADEPDDRLRGPTALSFELPGVDVGHAIDWQVTYQRVGERNPAHPEDSEVVGSIELAAGRLERP